MHCDVAESAGGFLVKSLCLSCKVRLNAGESKTCDDRINDAKLSQLHCLYDYCDGVERKTASLTGLELQMIRICQGLS